MRPRLTGRPTPAPLVAFSQPRPGLKTPYALRALPFCSAVQYERRETGLEPVSGKTRLPEVWVTWGCVLVGPDGD